MMEDETTLGIKGIKGENQYCGVGFVIIPKNVDVELYKKDVYDSGRISIYGGYGSSYFHNVLIDREVLQRIHFPKKVGDYGSPVVWINVPKHNEPIVIACLKYDEDFHSLSEDRVRMTRENAGNSVDFDIDGKKGKATLNIVGNQNSNGELEININSIKGRGLLKVIVNGKILEKSTDNIIRISENMLANMVVDKNGIIKAKIELNSEKENRLEYGDEFGNIITASKEGISINAKGGQEMFLDNSGSIFIKSGDNKIELTDSGINIESGSKPINLNGSFEALYNKTPGVPIADFSQIGVSKSVKIG